MSHYLIEYYDLWDHGVTLAIGCPLLPSSRHKGDTWGFIALLTWGMLGIYMIL